MMRQPVGTDLNDIGRALSANERHAALDAMRRGVAAQTYQAREWAHVGRWAQELGDEEMAADAAKMWVDAEPDYPRAYYSYARTLMNLTRFDEALEVLKKAERLEGAAAMAIFLSGTVYSFIGDKSASIDAFRLALSRDDQLTQAWNFIAAQKKFGESDPDLADLETAAAKFASEPAEIRTGLHFALFKAYDDLGDIPRAWENIRLATTLQRRQQPYDATRFYEYCDRLINTFSRGFFEKSTLAGCEDATPIFVLGPPRSGTTLLERMIAAHDDVSAGGEHELFRLASWRLKNYEAGDVRAAYGANNDVFAEIGRTYVERVRRRFGPARRATDKNLMNFLAVGVISAALPQASFVWVQRDIRDTVWSCFHTWLDGNPWSDDLGDAAKWVRSYERFMAHWQDALGARVHAVRYEDLVRAQDEIMPSVLRHAGLNDDGSWRRFHEASSPAATASLGQVTGGLTQKSIGAWRRYESFLPDGFKDL